MAARRVSWLVTGASSGLGQSIAAAALQAGHKVIGATRDVSKAQTTNPDFSDRGGIWVQLDPAQKDAYDQFAKVSREHDIDVLVNCAGYAFIGGVEDTGLVSRSPVVRRERSAKMNDVTARRNCARRWRLTFTGLSAPFEPVSPLCAPRSSGISFSLAAVLGMPDPSFALHYRHIWLMSVWE